MMEVPKYLVHVPCREREMVTNGESSDERDLSRNADTINRALREAGRRDCRKLIARSGE